MVWLFFHCDTPTCFHVVPEGNRDDGSRPLGAEINLQVNPQIRVFKKNEFQNLISLESKWTSSEIAIKGVLDGGGHYKRVKQNEDR